MSQVDAKVWIFDPAVPFKKVASLSTNMDTWHDDVLITRSLKEKLPNVQLGPKVKLVMSGSMYMSVDTVDIGIQIGGIQINSIRAAVVDSGQYDLLLGSSIFHAIFKSGRRNGASSSTGDTEETFRTSPDAKEDANALSLEIYPVDTPFLAYQLEKLLQSQRVLYNINLILEGDIQVSHLSEDALGEIIDRDIGIPDNLRLTISHIDSGSVWVSFKSGSAAALKRLASMFQVGASAKLSEQLAQSRKAENDVFVSTATRNETAAAIASEQEKLRAENIHQTYKVWREELLAKIDLFDQLIERAGDRKVIAHLKKRKNEAIRVIADQQMVPLIRNIPGSYLFRDDDVPRLPGPSA